MFRTINGARKRVETLLELSDEQVKHFISVFNALEREGLEEQQCISKAIGSAQETLPLEKATTDDVERDDAGNIIYRGIKYPAFNTPIADRGGKQGRVLAKKGDEIKVVRFGDQSMKDNYSVEANDAYYARHGEESDKFSAKYWSNKWLWPKGKLKGKGTKPFAELKKASESMPDTSLTPVIKALQEEQRISVEVVYVPNTPDAHGQYMSAETIHKACDNFNENLKKGNIIANKYHSKDEQGLYKATNDFSILSSYIIPVDCVVGDTPIVKGTWLAELKWESDSAWEARKNNVFHSTSIGALGKVHKKKVQE